jgi:Ca2+-binding RTX toxin-like protein
MARLISQWFSNGTTARFAAKSLRSRLTVEALESRRLLAANAFFNASAYQIEITGDGANDKVVVGYINNNTAVRVTMSEVDGMGNSIPGFFRQQEFPLMGVQRIQFVGNGGSDQLYNWTALATYAYGGAGNDKLASGGGFDYLDGGAGSDTYLYLPGQRGTDMIVEAANIDYDYLDFSAFGESAYVHLGYVNHSSPQYVSSNLRLFLNDATGIENVYGSEFHDAFIGNSRNNILMGNGGMDSLNGKGGDDYLNGGAGSDTYVFEGLGLGSDTIVEADHTDQDALDFTGFQAATVLNLGTTAPQAVSAGNLKLRFWNDLSAVTAGIEDVRGSIFRDVITGNSRPNILQGFKGNDVLQGGAGFDQLFGGFGDDVLEGGEGTDNLLGEGNNDTYQFAGTNLGLDRIVETDNIDSDTLDFTLAGFAAVVDLAAADVRTVSSGNLALSLGSAAAIENVRGTILGDKITGNARDNVLDGFSGADLLEGRSGNDILRGGVDSDTYFFRTGAFGQFTIDEPSNRDSDSLDFSAMNAGANVDLATTVPQPVVGTSVWLQLIGAAGIENVTGSNFDDIVRGNLLGNNLVGLGGNDTLEGRGGDDFLHGGENSDRYVFGNATHPASGGSLGFDQVFEAADADADTLDFSAFRSRVFVDLARTNRQVISFGALDLLLSSNRGIENIIGSEFDDSLAGNERDNLIEGKAGHDDIDGFGGNDILHGGRGKDRLGGMSITSAGYDQLFGDEDDDVLWADPFDYANGGEGVDFIHRISLRW